jgi:hypothetical protein
MSANHGGEVDWVALYVQRKERLDRLSTVRLSHEDVLTDLLEIGHDGLSVRYTGPTNGKPFAISSYTSLSRQRSAAQRSGQSI